MKILLKNKYAIVIGFCMFSIFYFPFALGDLYLVQGFGDDGSKVNGEVTLGLYRVNRTIFGTIFKNKFKDIEIYARPLPDNMLDAYSFNGHEHFRLSLSMPTFGSSDADRKIFACIFLINYFEKALLYVPPYANWTSKIKIYVKEKMGKMTLSELEMYLHYEEVVDNIPIAAAYSRIVKDMPGRKYSIERIVDALQLNGGSRTSRDLINDAISYYKKQLSDLRLESNALPKHNL